MLTSILFECQHLSASSLFVSLTPFTSPLDPRAFRLWGALGKLPRRLWKHTATLKTPIWIEWVNLTANNQLNLVNGKYDHCRKGSVTYILTSEVDLMPKAASTKALSVLGLSLRYSETSSFEMSFIFLKSFPIQAGGSLLAQPDWKLQSCSSILSAHPLGTILYKYFLDPLLCSLSGLFFGDVLSS